MAKILLLTDYSSGYSRNLLKGIVKYSKQFGPWVFYKMPLYYRKVHGEQGVVDWAKTWGADAIIAQLEDCVNVEQLKKLNIPIIVQNYRERSSEISNLTGDYFNCGVMAANFFLQRGFTNFAYYGIKDIIWSRERGEGFKFAFLSSSLNFVYPARFKFASQSINYVECHDNFTIFDKVSSIYDKNNEEIVLNIIKQINGTILLSIGIPFFHAGQEVGLTKYYVDNTYNKGDYYNKFRWDVLDKRYDMVTYLKSMITFKKDFYKVNEEKPENIGKMINFVNLDQNLLEIFVKALDDKEYIIIFNPTDNRATFVFDDYYKLICGQAGYLKGSDLYIKNSTIEPHCVSVFLKKEAE